LGALALVQLIRQGEAGSPAYIIGFYLSKWLGQGFLAISAFLGALGSFFSGSTTVSNLTFGDIQKVTRKLLTDSMMMCFCGMCYYNYYMYGVLGYVQSLIVVKHTGQ
jgi:L-lactate permease